ncbi:MAG: SIMPL domain-containing protein [Aeoliella sp.]
MMTRYSMLLVGGCLLGICDMADAPAQGFGGAGGFGVGQTGDSNPATSWSLGPELTSDGALNYITIEGTAELRVSPEEIRVVLAITSESETADECQTKNAERVNAVLASWKELDVPVDDVVEDFISVLPVYEWRIAERDGQEVRMQQREGYRMQSNLHIAVETEEQAMDAINRAFQAGVTDIVTFDYWSSQLDEQRVNARKLAVEAAKAKAELLLAEFDKRPRVINVQEATAVFFPHSLYHTYENILEESVDWGTRWREKPRILAYRPKMTFFQGLKSQADLRHKELPMRPEIAVISTVRLYYQSPAEHSRTVDN